MNNFIAMIPARIGSERLKYKNLALLDGKPLISYAISAAKKSGVFSKIYINSDHELFRDIAEEYDVNFYLRPLELGSSSTQSDDVVYDFAIKHSCKSVVWINPIAPLITPKDIQMILNEFISNNLDSFITADQKFVHCSLGSKEINFMKDRKFDKTQDLSPIKLMNYSIMGWNRDVFISHFNNLGYAMMCGKFDMILTRENLNFIIKTAKDLKLAEIFYKENFFDDNSVNDEILIDYHSSVNHFVI